jgi:hypothetical protein
MRLCRRAFLALGGASLLVAKGAAAEAEAPAFILRDEESGQSQSFTCAALEALPSERVEVSHETAHGPVHHQAEGPRLWQVITANRLLDPSAPRLWLRRSVLVRGADGYEVAIALGEIAPGFEDKPVLIALRLDGQALAANHLRLVVPGDHRGGRNLHDIVSLTLH